jgi:hypothetical protein
MHGHPKKLHVEGLINLILKEIKYYIVHFKDMNMESMHGNAPYAWNYSS